MDLSFFIWLNSWHFHLATCLQLSNQALLLGFLVIALLGMKRSIVSRIVGVSSLQIFSWFAWLLRCDQLTEERWPFRPEKSALLYCSTKLSCGILYHGELQCLGSSTLKCDHMCPGWKRLAFAGSSVKARSSIWSPLFGSVEDQESWTSAGPIAQLHQYCDYQALLSGWH